MDGGLGEIVVRRLLTVSSRHFRRILTSARGPGTRSGGESTGSSTALIQVFNPLHPESNEGGRFVWIMHGTRKQFVPAGTNAGRAGTPGQVKRRRMRQVLAGAVFAWITCSAAADSPMPLAAVEWDAGHGDPVALTALAVRYEHAEG